VLGDPLGIVSGCVVTLSLLQSQSNLHYVMFCMGGNGAPLVLVARVYVSACGASTLGIWCSVATSLWLQSTVRLATNDLLSGTLIVKVANLISS
jgi:hypothetical protein